MHRKEIIPVLRQHRELSEIYDSALSRHYDTSTFYGVQSITGYGSNFYSTHQSSYYETSVIKGSNAAPQFHYAGQISNKFSPGGLPPVECHSPGANRDTVSEPGSPNRTTAAGFESGSPNRTTAAGFVPFSPTNPGINDTSPSLQLSYDDQKTIELELHPKSPQSPGKGTIRLAFLRQKRHKKCSKAYGKELAAGALDLYRINQNPFYEITSKYLKHTAILPPVGRALSARYHTVDLPKETPVAIYEILDFVSIYDAAGNMQENDKLARGTWVLGTKQLHSPKRPDWLQLHGRPEDKMVYYIYINGVTKVQEHLTHIFGPVQQNSKRAIGHKHMIGLDHAIRIAEMCDDEKAQRILPELKKLYERLSTFDISKIKKTISIFPAKKPQTKLVGSGPHQCYLIFRRWTLTRHGSFSRLWFLLDRERCMNIGKAKFFRECKALGFNQCSLYLLWKYLDRDHTGTISLSEIDPVSAQSVGMFREWIVSKLSEALREVPLSSAFLLYFGVNEKGIPVQRLRKIIQEQYKGKLTPWLDLLGLSVNHIITSRDLIFFDRYKIPPYLTSQGDTQAFQVFKIYSMRRYGTSLEVWQILDVDGMMRVCWREFLKMFDEVMNTNETKDYSAGCAWRSLDRNLSGWASLQEFDYPSYKALIKFREICLKQSSSVIKYLESIEAKRSKYKIGYITASMMRNHFAELSEDEIDILMASSRKRFINTFRSLDVWDMDWEKGEETLTWKRRFSERRKSHFNLAELRIDEDSDEDEDYDCFNADGENDMDDLDMIRKVSTRSERDSGSTFDPKNITHLDVDDNRTNNINLNGVPHFSAAQNKLSISSNISVSSYVDDDDL